VVTSVRMRRLSERARLEGMLALRKALDGVRRGQNAALAAGDGILRAPVYDRRHNDLSNRWVRAQAERDGLAPDGKSPGPQVLTSVEPDLDLSMSEPPPVGLERDAELRKGLERIADSIERVAAQLDSYHQERAEHLDAIEFLLRELLIGSVPAPANRPIVLGGVVSGDATPNGDREISLVTDDELLEIDAAVEVRSRFHDRWIGGFTVAEAVTAPGRCRYRLTRRSDGIPLPILFDACDVRAAEDAFSRQNAPS
jgi:hypothetical protein